MFGNLYFDDELKNFLKSASSKSIISYLLIEGNGPLLNEEGNFISREKNELDVISYIPNNKYDKNKISNSIFTDRKNRTPIKIGRFVRKFLSKEAIKEHNITDKEIEEFVNMFKSYFNPDIKNLHIVSGEEILKWYLEENYSMSFNRKCGTLWNSCMRQSERNKFLKLYSDNPDKVKMLILLDDEGMLRSRALLWENVYDNNGRIYKFMDRVYALYDYDIVLFENWAKENGYITKHIQNSKSETHFDINGNHIETIMSIKLDNHNMKYYPYLDTFKFYDKETGIFSNYRGNDKFYYRLTQSNGSLEQTNISQLTYIGEDEIYLEDDEG